jgi:hypothetical protein
MDDELLVKILVYWVIFVIALAIFEEEKKSW